MINMTNVEYIDYFEKIIANEPENILSLYFVQKLMSDVRFRSFQPMISAELQKKILKMVLPKLKNQFKINRLIHQRRAHWEDLRSVGKGCLFFTHHMVTAS